MSMVARAEYTSRGTVRLTFPFERILIEALKEHIPASCRTFDPRTKTWTVSGRWQDLAVKFLLMVFPDAQVARPGADHNPGTASRIDNALARLHLLPSAPADLIEAAYRVLAKQHHPDAGGDTQMMQRLNGAYEVLKARIEP